MNETDSLKNVLERRNEYFIESFIKTTSEIVKFFSSIERVENYSLPETERKQGPDRPHLIQTDISQDKKWSYYSPKISRIEFKWLMTNSEIYREYLKQVLLFEDHEITQLEKLTERQKNDLYILAINDLEKDWNFHRSFHKVFHDVSGDTMLFLDLQAYCDTRHMRFFLHECFHYIEGNYVTTLRQEDKVYIPHLQFAKESVELPYSSCIDLKLENIIADYILKSKIKSVDQLLISLNEINEVRADVAKDEPEAIFLKTSKYIDHSEYFVALKDWILSINSMKIDFSNRNSIVNNIKFETLSLPNSIFRDKERLQFEDVYNYENDRQIFSSHKVRNDNQPRWRRRIIIQLFRDLIQYSINRHRIEIVGQQRTEYEEIFRNYRDMSFHEKDIGCLLVEDGEISFVLLMDRYINKPGILETTDQLEYWGLIEKEGEDYQLTARSVRMAKWCMKLMRLKYVIGDKVINYENKEKIARSYAGLVEKDAIFSWMLLTGNFKEKIVKLLGEMIFSTDRKFSKTELLELFKDICESFYHLNPIEKSKILRSLKFSRFQKELNEWLRAYESINRSVIAFPVNTIPSNVETKVRAFSIFIGTFHLDDGMYTDNEDEFEKSRRDMTHMLNCAKIFFSQVGIPASEALNETIIANEIKKHIEFNLGRYAHKVKNEGVNLVARMKKVTVLASQNAQYAGLYANLVELNDAVERLTGTVHILNIASNGLKIHYMEEEKYNILDVILGAYCNAFQQFFISGIEEERRKFWLPDVGKYQAPILKLDIDFNNNGLHRNPKEDVSYQPQLQDIDFYNDQQNHKIYTKIIDADDLLGEDSLNFTDILPQKVIMKSPFLEIFYNALTHMEKEEGKMKILELRVKRDKKKFEFVLLNPIPAELKFKPLTKNMKDSPGLQANRLFFKNIGGSFDFYFAENAISEIKIDFDKMMGILNK